METLVINVPEEKSKLVKQLLKELGVTINRHVVKKGNIPNALTIETIKNARKDIGIGGEITDIDNFINSL